MPSPLTSASLIISSTSSSVLLAQIGHHVSELRSRDGAVAILVEDAEGFDDVLLRILVLHFPCHNCEKRREVDSAVTVGVHLIDNVLQFRFSWVLSECADHCPKVLGRDSTITALVEQGESLLVLSDLFLRKLLSHGFAVLPL